MSEAIERLTTRRRSLLSGGAVLAVAGATSAAPAAATPPQGADAEVIALCAECVQHEVDWQRLYSPWSPVEGDPPAAIVARAKSLLGRIRELEPLIADLPALTLAGFRAKASVEMMDPGWFTREGECAGEPVTFSLLHDLGATPLCALLGSPDFGTDLRHLAPPPMCDLAAAYALEWAPSVAPRDYAAWEAAMERARQRQLRTLAAMT
jgi:hypothetical protein